jgi:hypothetical protein
MSIRVFHVTNLGRIPMLGIGDYPAELVNERTILPYGLSEGWTKPAMGLLITVGLAFLLIGVNSLVGPTDPAYLVQLVGP